MPKIIEYNAVWQSYSKNKKGAVFLPHGVLIPLSVVAFCKDIEYTTLRLLGYPYTGMWDIFPLDIFPGHLPCPDNFPRLPRTSPPAVKARIWKLALSHTPDSHRPTSRGIFMKTGTDPYTPDSNRSTSVNSLHVNGRSLYIVDWRMVVVECPTPCKKEGNCPGGGNIRGNVWEGICLGGNVRIPCGEKKVLYKKHFHPKNKHILKRKWLLRVTLLFCWVVGCFGG